MDLQPRRHRRAGRLVEAPPAEALAELDAIPPEAALGHLALSEGAQAGGRAFAPAAGPLVVALAEYHDLGLAYLGGGRPGEGRQEW